MRKRKLLNVSYHPSKKKKKVLGISSLFEDSYLYASDDKNFHLWKSCFQERIKRAVKSSFQQVGEY